MSGPEKIRAAGWRQGSVIERQSASEKLKTLLDGTPAELTHWVVITQDCDLVNLSYEKEPEVELLGCRLVASEDGRYTYGKNPRHIHLSAVIGGTGAVLDAVIFQRFCFPRPVLEDFGPKEGCSLPPETIRLLVEWVARRYTRSAFPDEFNERVRNTQVGLKKVLEDNGSVVRGVWLALHTFSELAAGEPYRVGVRVTMSIADYANAAKRDQASTVVNALEIGLTGCAGIEVESADLVSEADFPLSDLYHLMRFDAYDYLSNTDEA